MRGAEGLAGVDLDGEAAGAAPGCRSWLPWTQEAAGRNRPALALRQRHPIALERLLDSELAKASAAGGVFAISASRARARAAPS